MSTIGGRLRRLRIKNGLSQAEFADSLGISQSFLSDIERDAKMPGGETLLSLKRFFNISIDWLLSGELDLYIEGSPVRTQRGTQAVKADHQAQELRDKVQELENEILTLKGQITAYREMLSSSR